jgi:subtilisin-like proprotein convertase family protein
MPTGTARFFYETWLEDRNSNYTYSFSGTSAAAPVVSGALALVLEACPDLTYRDIKYLLAKTSIRVDTGNKSWKLNAAGLSHSNDYGYGLINVEGMIDECTTSYTTLPQKITLPIATSTNISTNISNKDYIIRAIDVPSNIKVEWVGLNISINSDYLESLEITLISPSGTESKLLHANNQLGNFKNDYSEYYPLFKNQFISGFRLSSVAFIDEGSAGSWQIRIISSQKTTNEDNPTIVLGTLDDISLEIVGH